MTETTEAGTEPVPLMAARALVAPATVDRAARTVEVVWSTGARARNFVPPLGMITEELDMAPAAVRMDGLRSGAAPVLNSDRRADARDVVGRVLAAQVQDGRGTATLQFSTADDVEPLWQRIADGTLRSVSVGYRVHRYEQIADPRDGTVHRAVDWEPYEISVVPVPIDPAASVRGEGDRGPPATAIEPALTSPEEPTMPDAAPAAVAEPPPAATPPVQETPTAMPTAEPTRATPPPAAALPPASDATADAVRAERDRVAALGPVAQAARALVAPATVDTLHQRAVAEGWTSERLRGALWDAMVQGARPPALPATPTATPANEDPAVIREAMADALAVRAMPGYQAPAGGRHVEFLGWRPTEMVAELMRARGERNVPRDTVKLAERAFLTTSDFPLLLSAAANKMLLAAYQPAQPTYRQIFLRRDFRDFKPHRHLRIGDFPTLVQLNETGEIQAGAMSESQELVSLSTFARRIRVTRPMLVNDDLGAFTDFAAMIGRRIADFENATAYAVLMQNNGDGPLLTTGNARVFSTAAARGNKAAAGTILDVTNVAAGRAALMKQKTLDGLPISVGQQMRLLVGPDRELAARQTDGTDRADRRGQCERLLGLAGAGGRAAAGRRALVPVRRPSRHADLRLRLPQRRRGAAGHHRPGVGRGWGRGQRDLRFRCRRHRLARRLVQRRRGFIASAKAQEHREAAFERDHFLAGDPSDHCPGAVPPHAGQLVDHRPARRRQGQVRAGRDADPQERGIALPCRERAEHDAFRAVIEVGLHDDCGTRLGCVIAAATVGDDHHVTAPHRARARRPRRTPRRAR